MKMIELFKNCTEEEIAEEFGKYFEKMMSTGVSCVSPFTFFNVDDLCVTSKCEDLDCKYLGEEYSFCYKGDNKCPFNLNLKDEAKRGFIEWLNTDSEEGLND